MVPARRGAGYNAPAAHEPCFVAVLPGHADLAERLLQAVLAAAGSAGGNDAASNGNGNGDAGAADGDTAADDSGGMVLVRTRELALVPELATTLFEGQSSALKKAALKAPPASEQRGGVRAGTIGLLFSGPGAVAAVGGAVATLAGAAGKNAVHVFAAETTVARAKAFFSFKEEI